MTKEQMKAFGVRSTADGHQDTLCVFCAKACNGACSWSDALVPVDGWTADRTAKGYLVKECPEFQQDRLEPRDPQALNDDGCIRLLEAMLRLMREDYISIPEARGEIERFIRNPLARHLFIGMEPKVLLQALRKIPKRF